MDGHTHTHTHYMLTRPYQQDIGNQNTRIQQQKKRVYWKKSLQTVAELFLIKFRLMNIEKSGEKLYVGTILTYTHMCRYKKGGKRTVPNQVKIEFPLLLNNSPSPCVVGGSFPAMLGPSFPVLTRMSPPSPFLGGPETTAHSHFSSFLH